MTCPELTTPLCADVAANDELVRRQIRWVMAGCFSERPGSERRRDRRIAYPYPVRLTPVDVSGVVDPDGTISVIGKHLAERGLDFYHSNPLPFRRVLASLFCGSDEPVELLLELSWCRFCRHGWYESGGRFAGPSGFADRLDR